MSNKKTIGKTSSKFTLRQFAWNGFNLTVGITFLGSLALLANPQLNNQDSLGLGFHMIWIFMLIGLVAGICAFAFAKLSRYHKSDNNGGAYIFARDAFGRFVGFLMIFLNYIILPLLLSYQVMMVIKANFDLKMATPLSNGEPSSGEWWNSWTHVLGNWGSLFYDVLGIFLTVLFASAAFFSTRVYKRATKYLILVKWVSACFLILCGVILACLPVKGSTSNPAFWAQNSSITFSHFLTAFCTCFFYFTGFETFATAGSTVKDPEKNIGKGIMIAIIGATLFYVSMTILFMFALRNFSQNPCMGFWKLIGEHKGFSWLIYAGPLIMMLSILGMRGNTVAMLTLYGGTTLQPMSQEGYISSNFGKQNQEGFPIGAMKLNIVITAITVAVWLIIPDFIVGFAGKDANFITVNTLIDATSVFYIVIYVIVLLAILRLGYSKVLHLHWLEWVAYFASLIFLATVLVNHFIGMYQEFTSSEIKNVINGAIELTFIVLCVLFVVIVYFAYYRKKYVQRLQNDPKLQPTLNYEFRVLDGWNVLRGQFYVKATNFLAKRAEFCNEHASDLSDHKFQAEYREMTDTFCAKLEKSLKRFVEYSHNVDKYNSKRHDFIKCEVDAIKKIEDRIAKEKGLATPNVKHISKWESQLAAKQVELKVARKAQDYNTQLCHMSSEEIKKHDREAIKYLFAVRKEIKTPASKWVYMARLR